VERIDAANRCDMRPLASSLAALASQLQQRQLAHAQERQRAFEQLLAAS
jgi:hypothetical protein